MAPCSLQHQAWSRNTDTPVHATATLSLATYQGSSDAPSKQQHRKEGM